ncbi:MAG: NUMOD4 domain-containing protein [Candidatus Limnocylindrus sp.]
MQEVWQPVRGYEGLYEVSDRGRVRSLPGKRWNGQAIHAFKGRILRPQCAARYMHVALSCDGLVRCIKIHQLVAEVFLPPCPGVQGRKRGCYHIDHINNDPWDNRACNLQWLTHYENTYLKARRDRDEQGRFLKGSPIRPLGGRPEYLCE